MVYGSVLRYVCGYVLIGCGYVLIGCGYVLIGCVGMYL